MVNNIFKEKKLQSRDATTFVLYENILLKWQQEQKKWKKNRKKGKDNLPPKLSPKKFASCNIHLHRPA